MAPNDKTRIKLLRQGLEGARGAIVTVSEHRAAQLINHKPPLAVPAPTKKAEGDAPKNKVEPEVQNKEAPLAETRRTGGQDGGAKPWSSSPEAQAPSKTTSTSSKGRKSK